MQKERDKERVHYRVDYSDEDNQHYRVDCSEEDNQHYRVDYSGEDNQRDVRFWIKTLSYNNSKKKHAHERANTLTNTYDLSTPENISGTIQRHCPRGICLVAKKLMCSSRRIGCRI